MELDGRGRGVGVVRQLALPMPAPTADVLCAGCCSPVEDCTCAEAFAPRTPTVERGGCGGCGETFDLCRCHLGMRRRHGAWNAWEGWAVETIEHPAFNDAPKTLIVRSGRLA